MKLAKSKFLLAPALALSIAAAPISEAAAYDRHGGYHHGGYGHGFGVGAAVGGLVTGAVLLATLPFRAVGAAVQPEPYYAQAPQPYYAPRPVYTREYVEAPPAYYYAPPPRYYRPAASYYPY